MMGNTLLTDIHTQEKIGFIGPCSLESKEQIFSIAKMMDSLGLTYIRTPLFKPRTRPDTFQGLGEKGFSIVEDLKSSYPNLKTISEVCSVSHYESANHLLDAIQIGSRNMQNFELLKHLGKNGNKHEFIMLKRGFSSTLSEWLNAAEYLIHHGLKKEKIILCERGIRDHAGTNHVILDFATALKAKEHGFKVIVDPSHGSKESSLVLPLLKASLALDFFGYMVEVHPTPCESVSDAHQAISIEDFTGFANTNAIGQHVPNTPHESFQHHNNGQFEQYKN